MAFTWITYPMGGESQETLLEFPLNNGTDVSLSNTVAITGARVYDLDFTTAGNDAWVTAVGYLNTRIQITYFGVYVVSAPVTNELPVLYDNTNGRTLLGLGTDLKFRLYDSAGNLLATSSAISTGTATWCVLISDPLTLGTSNVWCTFYIDGTAEWSLDIGVPGWGVNRYFGKATAPDCDIHLYLDDILFRQSTSASDSPDLVAYPRLRVDTAFPNADTSDDDWFLKAGSAGSADFRQWDELGGHDGDGTYNHTNTVSDLQLSEFQDAAQLGWGANALPYDAWLRYVEKVVGGSKFYGRETARLDGVYTVNSWDTSGPGAAYAASGWWTVSRPGGGAWTRADLANYKAGLETNSSSHDEDWKVTLLTTAWVYEDDTTDRLPLATTPSLPSVGFAHSHGYIF